jgi:RHS repeat-associated protein
MVCERPRAPGSGLFSGSEKETRSANESFFAGIPVPPAGVFLSRKNAGRINRANFCLSRKELDEETGFYYYGARYLNPKTSVWISADPAMSDYIPKAPVDDEARKHNERLPGMGGVFNYVNFHVYHYAGNNPIKYIDPDGKSGEAAALRRGLMIILPAIDGPLPIGDIVAGALFVYDLFTLAEDAQETYANHSEDDTPKPTDSTIRDHVGSSGSAGTPLPNNKKNDSKEDDIIENPDNSNPLKGEPGSTSRTRDREGQPKQDRRYGEDSYLDSDIDYNHDHGQGQPHQHKWTRPTDGRPPTHENRGKGVPVD